MSPVTPSEDYCWRGSEYLEYFPWESSEGVVEEVMRILPAHLCAIIKTLISSSQENIMITNLIGLNIVILRSIISTKRKFLLVNTLMLTAVKFVGTFHLPGLYQVLDNLLKRSFLVVPCFALQIGEVS